jgi:hypothetical protein
MAIGDRFVSAGCGWFDRRWVLEDGGREVRGCPGGIGIGCRDDFEWCLLPKSTGADASVVEEFLENFAVSITKHAVDVPMVQRVNTISLHA